MIVEGDTERYRVAEVVGGLNDESYVNLLHIKRIGHIKC